MKRKGLIITAVLALLAVSCGKNNSNKKGWDSFYSDGMKLCFGEVLPYAAFDKETTYCQFESNGYEGFFLIGDDNETSAMEGYGKKLEKKGFEAVYESEEDEEPSYYSKTDMETYEIIVDAEYYEETEQTSAGNEIYAEFTFLDKRDLNDGFKTAKDFYKLNGIKDVKIPAFETEAENLSMSVSYRSDYNTLSYRFVGPTRDEMVAYAESLGDYGYRYGEAQYEEDYLVKYKKTRAWFEVQDYLNYGGYINFVFYVGAEELYQFPTDQVVDYLSDKVVVNPNIFPSYPTGEDTVFEFDDAWASYYGGVDVYVRGTTATDCETYIARLQEKGWSLEGQDDEETWFVYVTGEEYNVVMTIYNTLDDYGYYDIFIGTVYVNPEPEVSNTFPLEELNAFLDEYDLGLEFTAGFADASGDGFTYGRIFDDPYHGFRIVVTGNQVSVITAALSPTILAGGYTQFRATETDNRFRNPDVHEIYITYDSGTNTTFVVFWE